MPYLACIMGEWFKKEGKIYLHKKIWPLILTYVICALQYFVLYNNMYQTSILSINNSFSELELALHSLITDYTPCTFITYPLTLHILE